MNKNPINKGLIIKQQSREYIGDNRIESNRINNNQNRDRKNKEGNTRTPKDIYLNNISF